MTDLQTQKLVEIRPEAFRAVRAVLSVRFKEITCGIFLISECITETGWVRSFQSGWGRRRWCRAAVHDEMALPSLPKG